MGAPVCVCAVLMPGTPLTLVDRVAKWEASYLSGFRSGRVRPFINEESPSP